MTPADRNSQLDNDREERETESQRGKSFEAIVYPLENSMKCQQVDMGSHWKIFGGLSFYKKKIKQLKSIWGKIATIDVKILQNFIGPP